MNSPQLSDQQRETYHRYAALALPRHTSYPAVPFWGPYEDHQYVRALGRSNGAGRDLSLYVHVPFCEHLCYFCTCTKEIMPKRAGRQWAEQAAAFLEGLEQELTLVAEQLDRSRQVRQLHLGGGSPTYLDCGQLARLAAAIHRLFRVSPEAEVAIEVDPRVTTLEQLHTLRELGFNRVSLGVQDFDPRVQRAVNRVQPSDLVARFVGACRRLGFSSINFDLIYGLPFQTPQSMARTVRKTIAMGPDRVAFYRMAVIPELFRWQNVFKPQDLPDSEATLAMFLAAMEMFQAAGYWFVGLDHFAKPDEQLARAVREGTVRRTFQGMTTGARLDVIGVGPSAISILSDAFAQNRKSTADWLAAVSKGRLATFRGLDLQQEDLLRQAVLEQLYCYGEINKGGIEKEFDIVFDRHFADELARLEELAADELVELEQGAVRVTYPLGRILVRVVAAVFDAYLPPGAYRGDQAGPVASRVG